MPSDPVVPDAILGAGARPGDRDNQSPAVVGDESMLPRPDGLVSAGGVGDSPVRGTLVADAMDSEAHGPAALLGVGGAGAGQLEGAVPGGPGGPQAGITVAQEVHGALSADVPGGDPAHAPPKHLRPTGDAKLLQRVDDSHVRGTASKALSRDLAIVQAVSSKVRRRAEHIEETSLRAPDYDLTGPKPDNVSARNWRIMQAAEKNLKAQPGWLTIAHKVADSYRKVDAVKPEAPTINSPLIQINVKELHVYPRRRVDET